MLSAVHIWKRWIQPVVCLPAEYQLLIIQSQQILQKTMIVPDCKEWKYTCNSKMSTLEYNFVVLGTVHFVVQAFALVRVK